MNVITTNPIISNNGNNFSSFAGERLSADGVKAFQWFVNYHDRTAQLPITGKWDELTKMYESKFGASFDKMLNKYPNIINTINDKIKGVPTSKDGTNILTEALAETKTIDPSAIATSLSEGLKATENTLKEEEKKARMMKIIATSGGAVVGFAVAKFVMKTNKPMILIGLTLVGAGAGFMVSKMMKKK